MTRIDNSKATLDFLLNLAAVLALFGVEYLIVSLTQKQGPAGLAALIFWLLAYLLYRAAWGRARAWGDAVQMAFDLYCEELRKALGLRVFADQKDELNVWERASGWLLPDPCIVSDRQFSQMKQKVFCARLSDYLDYVLAHPVRTAWEHVGLIGQRASPLL